MNAKELREGLARAICHTDVSAYCLWEAEDELIWGDGESFSTVEEAVEKHWRTYTPHADTALAYIRQEIQGLSYAIEAIKSDWCIAAAYQLLPHVLMRPSISIDGNMWCALYGENLQDGVAGFGDSPALAMEAFDREWVKKISAKDTP
jgi:hypothetical protein